MIRLVIASVMTLQDPQAGISGSVRDADRHTPVAGAVVELIELDRGTTSGADGRYTLSGVPAGPQHLTVRRIGYVPRTLHALVPASGSLEINIALSPVQVPERLPTVVVHRPVELRGAVDADHGSLIDESSTIAALRNNPLLTQPDVLQAISGGPVVLKPEAPGGLHIRGGTSDQTSYLLDGIPVLSPYHASGVFSAWNPDVLSHVEISSALPSLAYPASLSGSVAAFTRTPGVRLLSRGSVSSTHSALAVDGPLGIGHAGLLVSARIGYPHFAAPRRDPSYLRGATSDHFVKLELPAAGGKLAAIGYHSANEMATAARADTEPPTDELPRNSFEWQSQSVGFTWSRAFPRARFRISGWSIAGDAESDWAGRDSRMTMMWARNDEGLLLTGEWTRGRSTITVGGRVERMKMSYAVQSEGAGGGIFKSAGEQPQAAFFSEYSTSIGRHSYVHAGASMVSSDGVFHASPQVELRWTPSPRLTSSVSFARAHQFAQSVRNAESATAGVFPADLFIGSASAFVDVARSDLGVASIVYRPFSGSRVAVQAWERSLRGMVLVAPVDDEPFATKPFGHGSGKARGASIEASYSARRYGVTGSYGIQRVRYSFATVEYVPDHGPAQLFEGGVIFFPSATASVRLGVAHAAGRRTTAIGGHFEWESCNLLDRGCEFSGSPRANGEPLGRQRLPAYLRFDIGARKHWHATIAGRDATIGLFGALTNVLDRSNVLTYARDPATGTLAPVDMRPLAPLVVGLDWRF